MRIFGENPLTPQYLSMPCQPNHTTIIFIACRASLSRLSAVFLHSTFMETWPTAQEMSERTFFEWIIRLCGDRVGGCAFLLTSRVNYSILWLQFSTNCSTFGWSIESGREKGKYFLFHKVVQLSVHSRVTFSVKSRRKSFADRQFDFEKEDEASECLFS